MQDRFVETVRTETAARGKGGPLLAEVRLQTDEARTCVHVLHVGPYDAETATIARLVAFAGEHGYEVCGAHHEIYLGDPRRSAPEKLKTVLRFEVRSTA